MSRASQLLAAAVSTAIASSAAATERHVPSQYPTIQAAVDAADPGDVVVIADGLYAGAANRNIVLTMPITIRSANGPENCTIDCESGGRAFYFPTSQAFDARIEGLRIVHGDAYALADEQWGGAIFSYGARVDVVNCVFENNRAESGGAIATYGVYGHEIVGCTFTFNNAIDAGGALHTNGFVAIRECTISYNDAKVGGGADVYGGELVDCTIEGNIAGSGSSSDVGGGGARVSAVHLLRCAIRNNTASSTFNDGDCGGGGVLTVGAGNEIRDCVLMYNWAYAWDPLQGKGGAIYAGGAGHVEVVGSEIRSNHANWGGGVAGSATLVNCTLQDNDAGYSGGAISAVGPHASVNIGNAVVASNSAVWYGGGMYIVDGSCTVANTTFRENLAMQAGGAVYLHASECALGNCILWSNYGSIGHELAAEQQSWVTVAASDVAGGLEDMYIGGTSYVLWGAGDIDVDPEFLSATDAHVAPNSPCVDSGSILFVPSDAADLDDDGDYLEPVNVDGQWGPRIARFQPDMGAYEVPFGDLDCTNTIDFGDINPFVLRLTNPVAWQEAYPGCEPLYGDLSADGMVDFADINPFVAALTGGG